MRAVFYRFELFQRCDRLLLEPSVSMVSICQCTAIVGFEKEAEVRHSRKECRVANASKSFLLHSGSSEHNLIVPPASSSSSCSCRTSLPVVPPEVSSVQPVLEPRMRQPGEGVVELETPTLGPD